MNLVNGDEIIATRGGGCTFNGEPVSGKLLEPARNGRIPTVSLEASPPGYAMERAAPLLARAGKLRVMGSLALNLAYAAAGAFSLMAAVIPVRAFDAAAGVLQMREAGGTVTDTEGRPLELVPVALTSRTTILASLSLECIGIAVEALRYVDEEDLS
jgi:myo-inositol-1(or 4)-monophosphatase